MLGELRREALRNEILVEAKRSICFHPVVQWFNHVSCRVLISQYVHADWIIEASTAAELYRVQVRRIYIYVKLNLI